APPFFTNGRAQVNPHAVPSQVAAPFGGGAHGAHEVGPQLSTLVLLAQGPSQRGKPSLQRNPHEVPSQVGAALAGGAAHGWHDWPHPCVESSRTHAAPH